MAKPTRRTPLRILVPIDFSDGSRVGLRLACDLAAGSGAEVDLLHVYRLPPDPVSQGVPIRLKEIDHDMTTAEMTRNNVERALLDLRAEEAPECDTGLLAERGHPVQRIVERSSEYDLIVLGARRPHFLRWIVRRDFVSRVGRRARCPVLVVGLETSASKARALKWGRAPLSEDP